MGDLIVEVPGWAAGELWLWPTGVVYESQVGGCIALQQCRAEGYWVPLLGMDYVGWVVADLGDLHDDLCRHSASPSSATREKVKAVVEHHGYLLDDAAHPILEAWVPVRMTDGRRGFIVYGNCD